MAGSPVHTFPGFTMSVCQLRPESRGYVRIKSADPLAAPAMQPHYLSTPQRSRDDRRRHPPRAQPRRDARALAVRRGRIPAGPAGGDRRRSSRIRPQHAARRSSIRPAPARWVRRPIRSRSSIRELRVHGVDGVARRRLQRHADARLRQHQRAGHHDRGEGCRHDPARRRLNNASHEGNAMPCCHADFAAVDGSDRGFTVGMPTFTFGARRARRGRRQRTRARD